MHLEDGPVEMPEKGQLVATLGIREEGGYGSSDQPVAIKVQDARPFQEGGHTKGQERIRISFKRRPVTLEEARCQAKGCCGGNKVGEKKKNLVLDTNIPISTLR